MFKTIARAFLTAVFGACLVLGVAAVSSQSFGDLVGEFASTAKSSTKPKIVLPKGWRDYLAQHPGGEEKDDQSVDAGDVLSAMKQKENEKGEVIEHSYGGVERSFEQTYVTREYLTIISKTQKITVNEVSGNRGNCSLQELFTEPLPKVLKYGESIKMAIECENLIEVEAKTSLGSIKFHWDN